jgi:hypothetical protein
MAERQKPEIVALNPSDAERLADRRHDDTSEWQLSDAFVYRADGTPIIDKDKMVHFLDNERRLRNSFDFALKLFVNASDRPEVTRRICDDFLYETLDCRVQNGKRDMPLFVDHNSPHKKVEGKFVSKLELSPHSCEQFLGLFLRNIRILDLDDEVEYLASLAMQSYTDGAVAMALYEHLMINRWLTSENQESDFTHYTRVAKKLAKELIADQDFPTVDFSTTSIKIAGSVAFRRMMSFLRNSGYFEEGPIDDAILKTRPLLCLKAIRATQDDFFIGIAAPLDRDLENAYIKTAAGMATPRSV